MVLGDGSSFQPRKTFWNIVGGREDHPEAKGHPLPMAVASPSSSLLPSAHLQDFPYPPPPRCRRVIAFGSPSVLLRRSSPAAVPLRKKPPRRSWCCGAASSGPPSRGPDPPPLGDDPDPVAGLQVTLSRIQDKVRIFFAVLFWMSLFFWGSAWDGRENSRKNKGPPFRK